jgi:hypothetical protein
MVSNPSLPEFSLTYQGPALEGGHMEVRELAPALLALGDIFHEAQEVLYPLTPPVSLEIRAFNRGSFQVLLNLIEQDVVGALTLPDATALANLITYVTNANLGILAVIKRARGEPIPGPDALTSGTTRYLDAAGTTLEIPRNTRVLVQRTSIRKSARAFVEPLAHEGIDRIEIRVTDEDLLVIESDDVDAFNVPIPVESILTDEIKDMAVEVVQATLQGDYIWRLDEGDGPFSAHMADAEFIQRVKDRQVAFIAGDILFCQMRVRQWWENEKIHIDRTVIHVDRKVSPEDESDIDFRASFWGTDDAPDSFEQK